MPSPMADGIRRTHSPRCPARRDPDTKCQCRAGWEASVWSPRDNKKLRRTFPTFNAARTWRRDALSAVGKGTLRAPKPRTVHEAADTLVDGMETGSVRTRSGDPYKPSVIRSYRQSLALYVTPTIGALRLADVRLADVQAVADDLLGSGLDPSTIRNALMPLRVICRRALVRGDISVNPCVGLELPAVRGKRDRIAAPDEAATLLRAIKEKKNRAAWATAFYAGLRLGEIRGLEWGDVSIGNSTISVQRSLDAKGEPVDPKSRAGKRTIPIIAALYDELVQIRAGNDTGYVFGSGSKPFSASTLYDRAKRDWKAENDRREREKVKGRLKPIGLHEARHTYASILIAAGVNAKAISTYMGHSSIQITYDRYGHLMPGNEDEARALVDAYLERANTQARLAQLD